MKFIARIAVVIFAFSLIMITGCNVPRKNASSSQAESDETINDEETVDEEKNNETQENDTKSDDAQNEEDHIMYIEADVFSDMSGQIGDGGFQYPRLLSAIDTKYSRGDYYRTIKTNIYGDDGNISKCINYVNSKDSENVTYSIYDCDDNGNITHEIYITLFYDANGNIEDKFASGDITYAYDEHSNLTLKATLVEGGKIYTDGTIQNKYVYDGDKVASVTTTRFKGDKKTVITETTDNEYDLAGNLVRSVKDNSYVTEYEYNKNNWIISESSYYYDNPSEVFSKSYIYSKGGNLIKETFSGENEAYDRLYAYVATPEESAEKLRDADYEMFDAVVRHFYPDKNK